MTELERLEAIKNRQSNFIKSSNELDMINTVKQRQAEISKNLREKQERDTKKEEAIEKYRTQKQMEDLRSEPVVPEPVTKQEEEKRTLPSGIERLKAGQEKVMPGMEYVSAKIKEGFVSIPKNLATASSLAGEQVAKINPFRVAEKAITGDTSFFDEQIKKGEKTTQKSISLYQKEIENINKNVDIDKVGAGAEFIGDVLGSMPQMALNFIPGIGQAMFGITAMGGYSEQAQMQGASREQQLLYGAIGGIGEVTLQSVLGIIPGIKSLYSGNLTGKAAGKQILKNTIKEALEEGAIEPVMGFAEKLIYNPEKQILGKDGILDLKNMGKSAAAGATMSLLLSAAGLPVNYASRKIADKLMQKNTEATRIEINQLSKQYVKDMEKYVKENGTTPRVPTVDEQIRATQNLVNDLRYQRLELGMNNTAEIEAAEKTLIELQKKKNLPLIEKQIATLEAQRDSMFEKADTITPEISRISDQIQMLRNFVAGATQPAQTQPTAEQLGRQIAEQTALPQEGTQEPVPDINVAMQEAETTQEPIPVQETEPVQPTIQPQTTEQIQPVEPTEATQEQQPEQVAQQEQVTEINDVPRKENYTAVYNNVLDEIEGLSVQRLRNSKVMKDNETVDEFVDRIINQKSIYEGNRQIQKTGLQMLNTKNLWGESGESLRKSLLKYAKETNKVGSRAKETPVQAMQQTEGTTDIIAEQPTDARAEIRRVYTEIAKENFDGQEQGVAVSLKEIQRRSNLDEQTFLETLRDMQRDVTTEYELGTARNQALALDINGQKRSSITFYDTQAQAQQAERDYTNKLMSKKAKSLLNSKKQQETVTDTISRTEIVDFIRNTLGIPVATGKFRQRAYGIFKIPPEVIRLKSSKDIETLFHETGHFLDKKLMLTNRLYNAELLKLGSPVSRESYTNEEVLAEGVAEFVKAYSVNKAVAQQEAPGFYKFFETIINAQPDIKEMFSMINKMVDTYLNQSPQDRLMSNVSIDGSTKKKFSLENFYTRMFDESNVMRAAVNKITGGAKIDASKDPYILSRLYKGTAGKAESFLRFGIRKADGTKISKGFDEILSKIDTDQKLNDFRAFLVAQRAVELHDRGIETGIEIEDARAALEKYGENKDFTETAKQLYDYQDKLLDMMIDADVLSVEQKEQMNKLNKTYVPFYRVMETFVTKGGTGKGFETRSGINKIRGSEKDIIDPIESIIKNTYYFTSIADKNRVGVAFSDLAKKYEGSGKIADQVPARVIGQTLKVEELARELERLGADLTDVDTDQLISVFSAGDYGAKDNVITVWRNGKREYWEIFDEGLYQFFEGQENTQLKGLFGKLLTVPAKLLRAGAILNPDFMSRNPVRDAFFAAIFSKYGFIPGIDTAKGLMHVIKKDDIYQKWAASGAASSMLVSMDRNYYQRSLRNMVTKSMGKKALNVITHPIDMLRAMSEFTEESTRVRIFEKGIKKEGDTTEGIARAAMAAREGTLDFSRIGIDVKGTNQAIAFFNAALQGSDKMVRTFKEKPLETLLKAIAYISLPSIVLWFMNHDDERYKEIPQYQKDLFWIILTKDRVYRIPKPFEAGMMFGSSIERFLDYAIKEDKNAFEGYAEQLKDVITPSIIPTALLPLMGAFTNYDIFRNQQIVPMAEQNLEKPEQFNEYTSETAKLIGKAFNMSPRIIEHLVSGYGAGLANYGLNITDSILSTIGIVDKKTLPAKDFDYKIPGLRGFLIEPFKRGSESINKVYEEKADLETKKQTARKKGEPFLVKDQNRLSQLNKVTDLLSVLRKQGTRVYNSDELTAEQKEQKIEEITLKQINIARKALKEEPITLSK